MGRCWSKDPTSLLQSCGMNKSGDLKYNMMTIVNNTLLNTGNMLRNQIAGALTILKNNYMSGWIC